jgi:hypothetical protein
MIHIYYQASAICYLSGDMKQMQNHFTDIYLLIADIKLHFTEKF